MKLRYLIAVRPGSGIQRKRNEWITKPRIPVPIAAVEVIVAEFSASRLSYDRALIHLRTILKSSSLSLSKARR